MTPDQWVTLIVAFLSTGGIGGALTVAGIEAWREHRARKAKKEDAEAERKRNEEAALRAIDAFVTQKGFESITRLEQSLNETREDAKKAHLRADRAEKRADEADTARREMQREIDRMKQKQTERDMELADIKANHSDTLARLERSEKARLEVESALDTKTKENAALIKQLTDMQQSIDRQGKALTEERTKREALETTVNVLKQQVETITAERDQFRQKSDRLETENRALKEEQQRQAAVIEQQAARIEDQDRRIQELQSQLDTARDEKVKPDG